MKVCKIKDNHKIFDSVGEPAKKVFGSLFKKYYYNDTWNDEQINAALKKFVSGDYGTFNEKFAKLNNKKLRDGKGHVVGKYPNKETGLREDDLFIVYIVEDDKLYILSRYEFESFAEGWDAENNKLYDLDAEKRPPRDYGIKGRYLNKMQKEEIREQDKNIKVLSREEAIKQLPENLQEEYFRLYKKAKKAWNPNSHNKLLTYEENERYDEINEMIDRIIILNKDRKYVSEMVINATGAPSYSQIETMKQAIEGKGKAKVPSDFKQTLENLAKQYNVDYDDIVEKLAEIQKVGRVSLYPDAYDKLCNILEQPYAFSDSKNVKDNTINVDEDGSAKAFVIVKDGEFKTTPESDIKLFGKVDPKGLWKNFADGLEIEKENIKVEYIGSSDKEDYYKVECDYEDKLVNDAAKCDRCGREIDEDEETYKWGERKLCEECHSDLFDSKSIKDMFEPISSFKKFDFMDKTSQGFEIIHAYRDLDNDRMHVIVYRPNMEDYVIGLGYSPEDGTWNQGIYDLKSATDAEDALKEDYNVTNFDKKSIEQLTEDTKAEDVYLEDVRFNPRPETVGWSIIPEDDDTIGELRSKFLNQFVPYLVSNNIIDEEDADKFKASPSKSGYLTVEFPIKYNKEVKEEIKSFFNREISPVDLYYMTYKGIASKLVNAHKYSPATKAEKEDFINKHKDILIEMSKLGFKLDTPASLLESVYNNMALKKYPHQHANDSTDLSEILSLGIKLGFNTLSDIDSFSKSHGNVTDKELLEEMRKEAEKMEKHEEVTDSEEVEYYLGFEAEDDFDLFDSTELDEKIKVKFTGDVTDELAVRDALGRAANQVLNIREAEGEVDIEMMDPDDWYEIKFNRIWVEDKDGQIVGDHYKPVRVKKYFRK